MEEQIELHVNHLECRVDAELWGLEGFRRKDSHPLGGEVLGKLVTNAHFQCLGNVYEFPGAYIIRYQKLVWEHWTLKTSSRVPMEDGVGFWWSPSGLWMSPHMTFPQRARDTGWIGLVLFCWLHWWPPWGSYVQMPSLLSVGHIQCMNLGEHY